MYCKRKFLIIDDDPVLIELIGSIVKVDFNASTIIAKNSDEALERASGEKPSLIFLDLFLSFHNMYDYITEWIKKDIIYEEVLDFETLNSLGSGFKTASLLKNAEDTKEIPILGMSPLNLNTIYKSARSVGCDGYITKPFAIRDFVLIIKNLIKDRSEGEDWREGR